MEVSRYDTQEQFLDALDRLTILPDKTWRESVTAGKIQNLLLLNQAHFSKAAGGYHRSFNHLARRISEDLPLTDARTNLIDRISEAVQAPYLPSDIIVEILKFDRDAYRKPRYALVSKAWQKAWGLNCFREINVNQLAIDKVFPFKSTEQLDRFFQNRPPITFAKFKCHNLEQYYLKNIARLSPQLTSLYIEHYFPPTFASVDYLPNLPDTITHISSAVTPLFLDHVKRRCPQLTSLHIRQQLTLPELQKLSTPLPSFIKRVFVWTQKNEALPTFEHVEHVNMSCYDTIDVRNYSFPSSLKTLNINAEKILLPEILPTTLQQLLICGETSHLPSSTSMFIGTFNPSLTQRLPAISYGIKTLSLTGLEVDPNYLLNVSLPDSVVNLRLINCGHIGAFPHYLMKLEVDNCSIHTQIPASVTKLVLNKVTFASQAALSFPEDVKTIKLEFLDIQSFNFNCLPYLKNILIRHCSMEKIIGLGQSLKYLTINWCDNITTLPALPSTLVALDLKGNSIFTTLPPLPYYLRFLAINKTAISMHTLKGKVSSKTQLVTDSLGWDTLDALSLFPRRKDS